jgi:hypothetical protein
MAGTDVVRQPVSHTPSTTADTDARRPSTALTRDAPPGSDPSPDETHELLNVDAMKPSHADGQALPRDMPDTAAMQAPASDAS